MYVHNQLHRNREQDGGCQGLWVGENGEVLVKLSVMF